MEKVLIADFSSGKDRVTVRGLWQFDRGVKLKVIGINAADVNRVDFAPGGRLRGGAGGSGSG